MVKYSTGTDARVLIGLTGIAGGVEVTLTDYDVEPFDVTKAPDVDVSLPIEQRRPGGLGLHLINRLMDSVEYEYAQESRQSRITLRKTLAGGCRGTGAGGAMVASDKNPDGQIAITGRLDAAQAPAAQAFLDQVDGALTLDCNGLEYISSAGLGVLLKTQKRLVATGGKLRLTGVNRHLQD